MTKNEFNYWVSSRDNYDPGDGWIFRAGFDTADQAIAYAKELVDKDLAGAYRSGMLASELINWYSYGAEQPELRHMERLPPADFSVDSYMCTRSSAICGGAVVDPNSPEGQMRVFNLALNGRRIRWPRAASDVAFVASKSNQGESNE